MRVISFFRGIYIMLKKDFRLYLGRTVKTFLLLCLLVACAAAALAAAVAGGSSEERRLHMAIFDKEPSSLARQAVDIVANTEGVQSMFTVEICDNEEEVRSGMKNGIYDAAIIFEESYFSKILEGDDAGVCILLSDKLSAAGDMVRHFALTGEKLIKIAEAGIEAAYLKLLESHSPSKTRSIINDIQIDYAFEIFAMPTEAFEDVPLSYSESGVDSLSHYILCFFAFLLTVCEVLFFPFTAEDCRVSMLRRIKSYRISNLQIVLQKAVIPFVIRTVLLTALVCIATALREIDITVQSVLYAVICVLLISVLFAAVSVLLSQNTLGISVIFALNSASLVLCGGLIPFSMLPYEMIKIGEFTPVGLCINMLTPMLYGNMSPVMVAVFVAVTLALLVLACLQLDRICKRGGFLQ